MIKTLPLLRIALLTGAISAAPVLGQAQSLFEPFELRMIDTTDGSRTELYQRARTWMSKVYHTHRDVIMTEDKEGGILKGKGVISLPVKNLIGLNQCDAAVYYNITLEVKAGRYRCIMSDFTHTGCFTGKENTPNGGPLANEQPANKMSKKQWAAIKANTAEEGMGILRSLKQYMQNEAAKEAEW